MEAVAIAGGDVLDDLAAGREGERCGGEEAHRAAGGRQRVPTEGQRADSRGESRRRGQRLSRRGSRRRTKCAGRLACALRIFTQSKAGEKIAKCRVWPA